MEGACAVVVAAGKSNIVDTSKGPGQWVNLRVVASNFAAPVEPEDVEAFVRFRAPPCSTTTKNNLRKR